MPISSNFDFRGSFLSVIHPIKWAMDDFLHDNGLRYGTKVRTDYIPSLYDIYWENILDDLRVMYFSDIL